MLKFLFPFLLKLRDKDDGSKGGQDFHDDDDIDYPEPSDYVDESDEVTDYDEEEDDDVDDDDLDDDDEEGKDDADDKDKKAKEDAEAKKKAEEETKAKEAEETKKKQDAEKNRIEKEKRIAREKAAKEREEAQRKREAEIRFSSGKEALGGKNPFTGEEIKDEYDLEVAKEQARIKELGGDPIADYLKYHKQFTAEKRQKEAEESKIQEETRKKNEQEIDDFMNNHKDVNLVELLDNPLFKKTAEPLLDKGVDLETCYEIYQREAELAKLKEEDEKIKAAARKGSTPGSLGDKTTSGADDLYSLEELKKLTPNEVHANWKKVQKSYDALGKK